MSTRNKGCAWGVNHPFFGDSHLLFAKPNFKYSPNFLEYSFMQSLFRTDNITRQFIFYNVLIITPFSLLFLMYQVARIFGVDDIIMPGLVYNGINELFTFVGA